MIYKMAKAGDESVADYLLKVEKKAMNCGILLLLLKGLKIDLIEVQK